MNHDPSSPDHNTDRNDDGAIIRPNKRLNLVGILAVVAVVAYVGGNGMKNAWALQRRIECSKCMQRIANGLSTYNYDPATNTESPIEFLRLQGVKEPRITCPRRHPQGSNYVVSGLLSQGVGAETRVILYEPLSNHDGVGANVLFANGHAQFVKPNEYQELISKISAND